MKILTTQRITRNRLANLKNKTTFENSQPETTLASSSESDHHQQLIHIEPSQTKKPLNPLAFTLLKESSSSSSQMPFDIQPFKRTFPSDDEQYIPIAKRKSKPAKDRIHTLLKQKTIKPKKDSMKTKSIKKRKEKKNNITTVQTSSQYESSGYLEPRFLSYDHMIETNHKKEQINENHQIKSSNFGTHPIISEKGQKILNSNAFLTVKLQDKTNEIISMEIYSKLLKSYQDLLNEKIQSDLEYLKNIKVLVKENSQLYQQNQFYKARFPIQHQNGVKIENDESLNEQAQPQTQSNQSSLKFSPIIPSNQVLKVKQDLFLNTFGNIKLEPKVLIQNQTIQPEAQQTQQTLQQSEIGHLSSFGSEDDSSQQVEILENIIQEKVQIPGEKRNQLKQKLLKVQKAKLQADQAPKKNELKSCNPILESPSKVCKQIKTVFDRRRSKNHLRNSSQSQSSQKSNENRYPDIFGRKEQTAIKSGKNFDMKFNNNSKSPLNKRYERKQDKRKNGNFYRGRTSPIREFDKKYRKWSPNLLNYNHALNKGNSRTQQPNHFGRQDQIEY